MTYPTFIAPADNGGVGLAFSNRWGGVSTAPYNDFNLGRIGDDSQEHLADNYRRLSAATCGGALAIAQQVHGIDVAVVTREWPFVGTDLLGADGPARTPVADALVTTEPGVGLVIRVADCVPVLLADGYTGVIGAAHAGRRGLLAGVLGQTVEAMRQLGARSLIAWIGPHVEATCYEVPAAMAQQAWAVEPQTRAVSATGTPAIDLGAGAVAQLSRLGVAVTRVDPCTACDPQFFSHRRDGGRTGRQAGVIWLAAGPRVQRAGRRGAH